MDTYEKLDLVLVAIGMSGLIATFVVYYFQLRTMQKQLLTMQEQLSESRQASTGQNVLSLATFLQAEDVRDARTLVIESIDPRKYPDWTTDEKRAAAKVCSSYTVAGLILRMGVFTLESRLEILKSWGASIRMCHDKLTPYVRNIRKEAGPEYWSAYEWLFEEAMKMKPTGIAEPEGGGYAA